MTQMLMLSHYVLIVVLGLSFFKSKDNGRYESYDPPHCGERSQKESRNFPFLPPPHPPDSPTQVPPSICCHTEDSNTNVAHRSRLQLSHRSHRLAAKIWLEGCQLAVLRMHYPTFRCGRCLGVGTVVECRQDSQESHNARQQGGI